MIVCKRVPSDVTTVKLDTIVPKIKLIPCPKDIEPCDRIVQRPDENGVLVDVKIEKNTKEEAIVRITIPMKKMTAEEIEDVLYDRRPNKKENTSSAASLEHGKKGSKDKEKEKNQNEPKKHLSKDVVPRTGDI